MTELLVALVLGGVLAWLVSAPPTRARQLDRTPPPDASNSPHAREATRPAAAGTSAAGAALLHPDQQPALFKATQTAHKFNRRPPVPR